MAANVLEDPFKNVSWDDIDQTGADPHCVLFYGSGYNDYHFQSVMGLLHSIVGPAYFNYDADGYSTEPVWAVMGVVCADPTTSAEWYKACNAYIKEHKLSGKEFEAHLRTNRIKNFPEADVSYHDMKTV